tara:strand:+ start:1967 stop:2902 length:936 start_codon:yes stop_codon:yes gene_type:complete
MDERSNAFLSQGQSAVASMRDANGIIEEHNRQTALHFSQLRSALNDKVGSDRHADEGLDTIQAVGDFSTARRFLDARSRAQDSLRAKDVEAIPDALERRIASKNAPLATRLAESTGLRTGAEMIRNTPGDLASAGARAGQRFQEARGVVEASGEKAGVGVPTLAAKFAKTVGVGAEQAEAVGDVIGHGLGVGLAGYNLVDDLTMSHKEWMNKDPEQRRGNVLGIAGGIADTVSAAVPVLAPLALGLNIASGVEDWLGDKDQAEYQEKRTGGLNDQEKQAQEKLAPAVASTTGQLAQGSTSVRGQQGSSGAF